MNIIDRYLLRQFLQNFVICFLSLTGVYVVFDAFTNLEAFMSLAKGMTLMKIMAAYYGNQSLFFFDRISSLLVLMSAMFTMAWIQRHHEMTALMAAGISRIRVVAPVLVAAVAVILLSVINREVVIPKLKDQLAMRPSDLKGNVVEELLPQYDNATDVLIEGRCAVVDQEADRVARIRRAARQAVVVRVRQTVGGGPGATTCRRKAAGPRAICSRTLPSRRTWRNARRWRSTAGRS